jgi:hypothetical protein
LLFSPVHPERCASDGRAARESLALQGTSVAVEDAAPFLLQ